MFSFYPNSQPSAPVKAKCTYPGCTDEFVNQESRSRHLWKTHLAAASIMQTALFTCYECNLTFTTELDKSLHMLNHPGLKTYTIGDFQRELNVAQLSTQRQRDRTQVCHQPPAGSQSSSAEDASMILRPFLFCPVQDCPSTGGFCSEPTWKRHKNTYHPELTTLQPVRKDV
uniref:Histone demethylase n=1 Tax=Clandestinovirus TaxID=2831644 RepID=A0A8F8KTG9_9VIRU|nr:histone demethylase [Clandestinovirus]